MGWKLGCGYCVVLCRGVGSRGVGWGSREDDAGMGLDVLCGKGDGGKVLVEWGKGMRLGEWV